MVVRVWGAMVVGIRGLLIEVEADVSTGGLPSFTLVGLPDAAVRESRERVLSALRHSDLTLPPRRITVNLAPGHVHKAGAALDLPIAIGLATAAGHLPHEASSQYVLAGELSLGGDLKPVRGVLSMAIAARAMGRKRLIVPEPNLAHALLVPDVEVYPARTLGQVAAHLRGEAVLPLTRGGAGSASPHVAVQSTLDLADVRGQHQARRALEIAAAGQHNVLFVGPPGAGKTLLASRLPSILPPLTREEAIDVTQIHSVVSPTAFGGRLVDTRPFRAPHHTISDAGLVGGGEMLRPGELSLAHRGVLFLDELPEFRRSAIEALRQPLEAGLVRIARARGVEEFPARFQLVAAMNPCPCGHYGDTRRECQCPVSRLATYRARISGPILDRIDMWVYLRAVPARELTADGDAESSATVRNRVLGARAFRTARRRTSPTGARLGGIAALRVDTGAAEILTRAIDRMGLSARSHRRLLRVARTIADLAGSERVRRDHVAEALSFRAIDPLPQRPGAVAAAQ